MVSFLLGTFTQILNFKINFIFNKFSLSQLIGLNEYPVKISTYKVSPMQRQPLYSDKLEAGGGGGGHGGTGDTLASHV